MNVPKTESKLTAAHLEALHELAVAIASETDVDTITNLILNETTRLTGAEHGSILLSKSGVEEERFTTLVRSGEKAEERLIRKMCMMVAGWVLKHREPLLEANLSEDSRFSGLKILDLPVRSLLAVPIQTRGEVVGVLVLHNGPDQAPFKESDLHLANIIASQCGPVLENARLLHQLREENRRLKQEVERKYAFEGILGRSPAMAKVFKLLEKVIPTDARVLIQGESGTGKELVARAIHYNGPRKQKRFVAVDCGALPETLLESELFGHVRGAFTGATESKKGLFHVADGGTIFLDEINNTTPALQAKLLRVIQEGEIRPVGSTQTVKVDVRVLAASSRDLAKAVEEGAFRQDLFYRLKVVTIKLPPLRERSEDILLLAEHFLKEFAETHGKNLRGFTREAAKLLRRYHWPGNVRELENVVESCVVLAEPNKQLIDADLFEEELYSVSPQSAQMSLENLPLDEAVEHLERRMVSAALRKTGGNRTRAAQLLGLSRRGLLNKIERYGLERPEEAAPVD